MYIYLLYIYTELKKRKFYWLPCGQPCEKNCLPAKIFVCPHSEQLLENVMASRKTFFNFLVARKLFGK